MDRTKQIKTAHEKSERTDRIEKAQKSDRINLDMSIVTEENYSKPYAMAEKRVSAKEAYSSKVEKLSNKFIPGKKKVPIS